MAGGGLVEGGGHHFAAHGAGHFGYFFGALVDQQNNQHHFGIVGSDGVGDVLQHHGFAGFGRRHQKGALAHADGGNQIDGTGGDVLFGFNIAFEFDRTGREEGGKVFKQDFVFAHFRVVAVDFVEAHEGEIALVVFGYAHAAFDGVAGVQVEAADLVGGNVDIVGAGQIGSVGAAQEAEAVGQDFERAGAAEALALFHHVADDGKHQILLAQAVGVFNAVLFGHFQ